MTLVANYDRAGTNRFCSHILSKDETKTICGIKCWEHNRDWQDTGDSDNQVGCIRCRRIVAKTTQAESPSGRSNASRKTLAPR